MVDQMNQWILVQRGFISSFDLPWSEWSRMTDPDPDYQAPDGRSKEVKIIRELLLGWPKGGHPSLIEIEFTIFFHNYLGILVTGCLIEGSCLMEVYTAHVTVYQTFPSQIKLQLCKESCWTVSCTFTWENLFSAYKKWNMEVSLKFDLLI